MKVGLLLYDECLASGLFSLLDLFAAANQIAGTKKVDVQMVSMKKKVLTCAHGQKITAFSSVSKFKPDILIIPGFWAQDLNEARSIFVKNSKEFRDLVDLSSDMEIWSYCTGVLLHASLGRLQGKAATATWWLVDEAQSTFPKVKWQFQKTFVLDKKNATASGANGYLQIAEQMFPNIYSKKVIQKVMRYLLMPRPYDANAFFPELDLMKAEDLKIKKLKTLVEGTAADQLYLPDLAMKLNTSVKTLDRKIRKELGSTLGRYVKSIKYAQASDLLVLSQLSIKEICDELGFSDESNFRRGFKSMVGEPPAKYRDKLKR